MAKYRARVRDMVFDATFNNISVISWRSVLFVEETGVFEREKTPTCRMLVTNFIT
jgi:pectin methylesterase-like acyl-CoA thioesterase